MLPRLIIIADRFTHHDRFDRVCRLVQAGLPCLVQLRDHEADRTEFISAAAELKARTEQARSRTELSVNARLDSAQKLGTHLHAGKRGPDLSEARRVLGPDVWIGYSAHAIADLEQPDASVLDYVTFSPVFPPISKPERAGQGLAAMTQCIDAAGSRPVFALGGVSLRRVDDCLSAGAYGVATLSAVMHAQDPVAAAAAFLDAIDNFVFEHNVR